MNKTKNTDKFLFEYSKNKNSFFGLLKCFFAIKGMLDFDASFKYSNGYHEKIPILYANIRV